MTKIQYAVISAGLIFEAIRQGFLGISDGKGSRGRDLYLRGLFAMKGPLVRYNGEKLDDIMDLIQMSSKKDFDTAEKIKTMVSAGFNGRSVQVALYPFLTNELAIDIVVHHVRIVEARGLLEENPVKLFARATVFVSESTGISSGLSVEYCKFILEQMLAYQGTTPPLHQGGVVPTRVAVT